MLLSVGFGVVNAVRSPRSMACRFGTMRSSESAIAIILCVSIDVEHLQRSVWMKSALTSRSTWTTERSLSEDMFRHAVPMLPRTSDSRPNKLCQDVYMACSTSARTALLSCGSTHRRTCRGADHKDKGLTRHLPAESNVVQIELI